MQSGLISYYCLVHTELLLTGAVVVYVPGVPFVEFVA
jgi:hypothetical protein